MSCIFCSIIKGEVPSQKVYEDEKSFVIKDINPQAPIHLLVLSKEHIPALRQTEKASLLGHLLKVCSKVALEKNLSDGYRVVINDGENAGQSVPHLHFHILGARPLRWPPG